MPKGPKKNVKATAETNDQNAERKQIIRSQRKYKPFLSYFI